MSTRSAAGHSPAPARTMQDMDLIDAHLKHLRAAGFSPRTVGERDAVLRRINRELPMGLVQATVEELEDWLAREGWAAETRKTYYTHVAGFFTWATDPNRPRLDWNPVLSLIRPKAPPGVPRPVSDAELGTAMKQTSDPYRRLVVLAAYAGLRCCELATIDRADISESALVIRGKGGKERVVPTSTQVWACVKDLPGGLIAGGFRAEDLHRGGNRYLKRHVNRDVSWHRFRHWFGTTLLANGADLRTVQELMGHSSPATTAIYTQITDRQRQIAIAALPVLDAPESA